jgi:hypothetical protein
MARRIQGRAMLQENGRTSTNIFQARDSQS